jgi:glycolate oxidase FAD binding subunit
VLSTQRLNQIAHYDPGDLTIGVGAGALLGEVQKRLREHGQFLPLDPPRAIARTVGGVLAGAASGPLRHSYGGVRDFCIGIRFVTGDGELAKGGGRVVKNVAGYDLMKLLIGSHGSLGVIVEANFKVMPAPRQTATFFADFASLDEAIAFRRRLTASPLTPLCLELITPRAHEYLAPMAAPRDPDHHAPLAPLPRALPPWRLGIRAAGSDAVLARFRRELGAAVAEELGGAPEAQLWQWLADFELAVLARHRNAMVFRLEVPVAEVGSALAAAEKSALDENFLMAAVGRAGIGSLVIAFVPLAVDPPGSMKYAAAASALRSALSRDASAVVVRCPVEAKRHFDVRGSSPTDLELMRGVKHALDPQSVLVRGRAGA